MQRRNLKKGMNTVLVISAVLAAIAAIF